MYLKVKSKKLKNLSVKIAQAKNNLVVNILNKKGYECDSSQISQIKANRKLNSEQKKVIFKNWKLLCMGSRYYSKNSRQSNRKRGIRLCGIYL